MPLSRILLGLGVILAGAAIVIVSGIASAEQAPPPGSADVEACDKLAAAPYDRSRKATGVCRTDMVKDLALESCERAVAFEPANPRLQFQLGRAELLTRQEVEGFEHLSAAAVADYPAAMIALWLYDKMDGDDAKAFEWARKAAALNHPVGQYLVGEAYLEGSVVPQSKTGAIEWFELAARQGEPLAQARLGGLYAKKELGVVEHTERSLALTRGAAAAGVASAQIEFGDHFAHSGSQQDLVKARNWYAKAAEQGSPPGRVGYGILLKEGSGGPRDARKAFEQVHLAALSGHSMSQLLLSRFYKDGIGVLADLEEAYVWASIVAEQKEDPLATLARHIRLKLAEDVDDERIGALNKKAQEIFVRTANIAAPTPDYCFQLTQ